MEKYTLKKYRLLNDMTQEEVAEKLNVSLSTVSKWERGITFPLPPQIDKICQLYNINYMQINFYPNIPFKSISVA